MSQRFAMARRTNNDKLLIRSLLVKFILALLVITFTSILINKFSKKTQNIKAKKVSSNETPPDSLRYWGVCIRRWNKNGNLRTMNRVFRKLGYSFVNGSLGDDWDVLWSIEYPFKETQENQINVFDSVKKLSRDQRVNHIPGLELITNKATLGTETKSRYLLPTFKFPENEKEFTEFSAANPHQRYVEKNVDNRGVRVVTVDEFDKSNSRKIYQVFLNNPYLIEGHAFDFGVYVLVSSIDPLRIYRYEHEVFMRFCPEKYHPFDPQNRDKFVVADNHMAIYEIPPLKTLYDDFNYTSKEIFENHVTASGVNVADLWAKIDDAILSIILQNHKSAIKKISSKGYNSTLNFFELVRFDIVFDEKLNPIVMEVNMSPNLTPAKVEHERNSLIYEQLIFNTLSLIGAGCYFDFLVRFNDNILVSNFKHIATKYESCVSNDCHNNCTNPACKICLPCVEDSFIFHMIEAHREHNRRGNFKRIFPSDYHYKNERLLAVLSESNQLMSAWFEAKCESDESWC